MTNKYRPCVGIALFNNKGQLFIAERTDNSGCWQMPQGGIDEGESATDAFFREMKEEIGTNKADILQILDEPLRYEWPKSVQKKFKDKFVGQEQTWIAGRFTGTDDDIDLESFHEVEFKQWKWVTPSNVLDLMVPFKKETYKDVLNAFQKHY